MCVCVCVGSQNQEVTSPESSCHMSARGLLGGEADSAARLYDLLNLVAESVCSAACCSAVLDVAFWLMPP